MHNVMKKTAIVVLIILGGVLGFWMARQNQKLFELPLPEEETQKNIRPESVEMSRVNMGMDTWQVREMLGAPDKSSVVSEGGDVRKEEWVYGSRHLYFANGILTSWREQ